MTDNKEAGSLGWLFLIAMIMHVMQSLAFNLLMQKGIVPPTEIMLIFSELTILVPPIIYVLVKRLSFRDDLGFRPIKAGTFFMSILMLFLVMPIASFFNALSQLFVSNTMIQMSDQLLTSTSTGLIIIGGFVAPFCEEFMFRSVFCNRYDRIAGPLRAALISAMLFALAHMNINQACYAFVLGFIFAVINKAAGSVFPSMIIHIGINALNLLLLVGMKSAYTAMGMDIDIAAAAEATRTTDVLYVMIAVTLVIAIVCTAIAIPCTVFIAKNEGRMDELTGMFTGKHPKIRWLTVSLILGICFVLFMMFGLKPFLSLFS